MVQQLWGSGLYQTLRLHVKRSYVVKCTSHKLFQILPSTSGQRYWAAVATQFLTVALPSPTNQLSAQKAPPLRRSPQLAACGAIRTMTSNMDLKKWQMEVYQVLQKKVCFYHNFIIIHHLHTYLHQFLKAAPGSLISLIICTATYHVIFTKLLFFIKRSVVRRDT